MTARQNVASSALCIAYFTGELAHTRESKGTRLSSIAVNVHVDVVADPPDGGLARATEKLLARCKGCDAQRAQARSLAAGCRRCWISAGRDHERVRGAQAHEQAH